MFLLQSAIAGLALAFVVLHFAPGLADRLRGNGAQPSVGPSSYASAVKRASPAVVSLYANRIVTERVLLPPDPITQRFSGLTVGPTVRRREPILGSGVIVSQDGYVLTNHHVITGADQIRIALWDGRVTDARVVGSDAETDLAVLKVEGSGLPALSLDPAIPLEVGDVVLAIGNALGLSQTVTLGIVSGLGRTPLNQAIEEEFIQTDAAINEGNSGGALVNSQGQLVGINTFVLGRRNGAEGIGFAIPMRVAADVFSQIRDSGVVTRGWMGAEYGDAPVLPGSVDAFVPRGVALTEVYVGGPAHIAGLRPGDVLLSFDGETITDQAALRGREAGKAPGSKVEVAGLRAGVPFVATLDLIQRPSASR
ncbi:S1C family serine protease [Aquimonas voraii]|uniref:S1C family serine protease n=1 Tax=Aquimonas voraii TaxID=265719 RepID=UPI001FE12986|nr:trypsin-like peptidase domain-containing protein [Aquimonas voraii]